MTFGSSFLRKLRWLSGLGFAIAIGATSAWAEPTALEAKSVIEGWTRPGTVDWGSDYATWQSPERVVDLAWRAYRGTVSTSASDESRAWSADNLGDSLPSMFKRQVQTRE